MRTTYRALPCLISIKIGKLANAVIAGVAQDLTNADDPLKENSFLSQLAHDVYLLALGNASQLWATTAQKVQGDRQPLTKPHRELFRSSVQDSSPIDQESYHTSGPENCGCDDLKQSDYRGSISKTENGHTCKDWVSFENWTGHGLENNNHCRNPNQAGDRAWCFIDDEYSEWEYCEVPSCTEEEEEPLPASYTFTSATEHEHLEKAIPEESSDESPLCSGSNPGVCGCQEVNQSDYRGTISVTSHGHKCKKWINTEKWPGLGLENNNYCRNPNRAADRAWCYIDDAYTQFDYCIVPVCGADDNSKPLNDAPSDSPSSIPSTIPSTPPSITQTASPSITASHSTKPSAKPTPQLTTAFPTVSKLITVAETSQVSKVVRRYVPVEQFELAIVGSSSAAGIDTTELSSIMNNHLLQYLDTSFTEEIEVVEVEMVATPGERKVRRLGNSVDPNIAQVSVSGFAFFIGNVIPATDYVNNIAAESFDGEGNEQFMNLLENAYDPFLRSVQRVKRISQRSNLPSAIVSESYLPRQSNSSGLWAITIVVLVSVGVVLAAMFIYPRMKQRKGDENTMTIVFDDGMKPEGRRHAALLRKSGDVEAVKESVEVIVGEIDSVKVKVNDDETMKLKVAKHDLPGVLEAKQKSRNTNKSDQKSARSGASKMGLELFSSGTGKQKRVVVADCAQSNDGEHIIHDVIQISGSCSDEHNVMSVGTNDSAGSYGSNADLVKDDSDKGAHSYNRRVIDPDYTPKFDPNWMDNCSITSSGSLADTSFQCVLGPDCLSTLSESDGGDSLSENSMSQVSRSSSSDSSSAPRR